MLQSSNVVFSLHTIILHCKPTKNEIQYKRTLIFIKHAFGFLNGKKLLEAKIWRRTRLTGLKYIMFLSPNGNRSSWKEANSLLTTSIHSVWQLLCTPPRLEGHIQLMFYKPYKLFECMSVLKHLSLFNHADMNIALFKVLFENAKSKWTNLLHSLRCQTVLDRIEWYR